MVNSKWNTITISANMCIKRTIGIFHFIKEEICQVEEDFIPLLARPLIDLVE